MEKLKPFLDGLKAQKFWIFCGVTLIACVVVYYMVSGSLATEEKAAEGKIKSTITSAKNLETAGVPIDPSAEEGKGNSSKAHPNEATVTEMRKVVVEAAKATSIAWGKKYELQSSFQVFDKNTIREPNVDFQKYLPAESVEFSDSEEGLLAETVRVNYRDRIRDELPRLADLTRSVWKPAYEKGENIPKEVVIWAQDNQDFWHSRFTNFSSEWNTLAAESNVPKTLQVLYTTEDLWLLRSILKDVVAKTVFDKGDIYANDLSVIKQIDHILIGKVAEKADEGLPGQAGGGGMMGGSGGSQGMMASSRNGGGGAGGKKKKSDSTLDPINGRYVDNEGKTIPSKDYRALYAKKGATDKKKTHWKIAKRVKVRIGLQMDTREIQSLLANCANATFPIEVRALRVNKHTVSKLSGSGAGPGGAGSSYGASGGGGKMGGSAEDRAGELAGAGGKGQSSAGSMMPGSGGASSGGGASGGGGGMAGGGKQSISEDDEGYTKPVEIYGFMYIYNKVDDQMFKILDEKTTTP